MNVEVPQVKPNAPVHNDGSEGVDATVTKNVPFTATRRDPYRYGRDVHQFSSVGEFLAGTPTAGIIAIDAPQPIEILYVPAGGETTVVTFHSALTRQGMPLPMFAGAKVTSDNNANRIFISDPGLYSGDDVTLAWFSGTSDLPLQSILPSILGHLIEAAGGTRTLFWGPSAGGFAALFYSRFFPGSLAVPINPQTILSNFGYGNQRVYTSAAFAAETHEDHVDVFTNVICSDLRSHYNGELTNYVLYVQNSTDHHVEQHMEPFLSSLTSLERIRIYMGSNWGEGHVAPPPERTREILAKMTDPETDWDLLFKPSDEATAGGVAAGAEAILIESDSLHDWLVGETRKDNLA